jgi:hypothetical protein
LPPFDGASFGFVDMELALLALEEDALPRYVAGRYELSGVPLVTLMDIFAEQDSLEMLAAERGYVENEWAVSVKPVARDATSVKSLLQALTVSVDNGMLTIRLNGYLASLDNDLVVALYTPHGRLLHRWVVRDARSAGVLRWSTNGAAGNAVLVVRSGGVRESRVVSLR